MKHKYIIDRKSTQFVDDHIHIRGNFFEVLAILQFCKLNIFKLRRGGINWTPDSESAISDQNITTTIKHFFVGLCLGVTIPGIYFNPGISGFKIIPIPGFFGIVSCEPNFCECQFGKFREERYVSNLIIDNLESIYLINIQFPNWTD